MKTILSYVVVLTVFGCTSKTADPAVENTATDGSAYGDSAANSSDCLDRKLEAWFIAFNNYQNQGALMGEADQKAFQDSEKVYQDCVTESRVSASR